MLLLITTGGTIDKVYFDASSDYEIGEPTVPHVFRESGVALEWRLLPLLRKDSLEMNGTVFPAGKVRKNRETGKFEAV